VVGAIRLPDYITFCLNGQNTHPSESSGKVDCNHGAILGGLVVTLIFARLKQISFWQLVDLVSPSHSGTGDRSLGISSTLKPRASHRFALEIIYSPDASSEYATCLLPSHLPLRITVDLMFNTADFVFRSLKAKPRLKAGTLFLIYL